MGERGRLGNMCTWENMLNKEENWKMFFGRAQRQSTKKSGWRGMEARRERERGCGPPGDGWMEGRWMLCHLVERELSSFSQTRDLGAVSCGERRERPEKKRNRRRGKEFQTASVVYLWGFFCCFFLLHEWKTEENWSDNWHLTTSPRSLIWTNKLEVGVAALCR